MWVLSASPAPSASSSGASSSSFPSSAAAGAASGTQQEPSAFVWDAASGAVQSSFRHAAGAAFVLRGGGEYLLSAGRGACAWDLRREAPVMRCATPEPLLVLATPSSGASAAAAAAAAWLVAGAGSGRVYVWSSDGELCASVEAHYRAVRRLAWAPDDVSLLYSGADDALVRAWTVPSLLQSLQGSSSTSSLVAQSPLVSWSEHTLPITALLPLPGRRVLSCSLDRSCRLWRVPAARSLLSWSVPAVPLCVAVASTGSDRVWIGCADGSLHGRSISAVAAAVAVNASERTVRAHDVGVTALAASLDGQLLVSGAEDGSCRVWAQASMLPLHAFDRHRTAISYLQVLLPNELPALSSSAESSAVAPSIPIAALRKFAGDASSSDTASTATAGASGRVLLPAAAMRHGGGGGGGGERHDSTACGSRKRAAVMAEEQRKAGSRESLMRQLGDARRAELDAAATIQRAARVQQALYALALQSALTGPSAGIASAVGSSEQSQVVIDDDQQQQEEKEEDEEEDDDNTEPPSRQQRTAGVDAAAAESILL